MMEDISKLDEEKEEMVAFFQSRTKEDNVRTIIQCLEENRWDLESSIRLYNSRGIIAARPPAGWIPWLWNLGYNFFAAFLPSQADQDPVLESRRFISEIELRYGNKHPQFLEGTFQTAMSRAKSEYKFLVVYLHAPLHQDTDQFCHDTLCTDLITDFLTENFLVWGAKVNSTEGYKTSNLLSASTYPFLAVVCNNSVGGITICERIEGLGSIITSENVMSRLTTVLEVHGPTLLQARLDFEERDMNRKIREEQDSAYQESLKADEAKAKKIEEEKKRLLSEREEQEREIVRKNNLEEEKNRLKEIKRRNLPTEPEAGPNACNLVIRLTDGSRLQRRFRKNETIETVCHYVDVTSTSEVEEYDLVSNFPRNIFTNRSITLELAGLHPQASLFVQSK